MSKNRFKSVRGFADVLPEQARLWNLLEQTASEVFEAYGFSRIITPVVEFSDLYARAVGGSTDLAQKEMYSFTDRDGSELALRPEGTAGVVRAFVENSLHASSNSRKLYYFGGMFRHERPQKGRMRGFHQIGAEFFGSGAASEDCEVMAMLWHFLSAAGASEGLTFEINSIGTPDDRKKYKAALRKFLKPLAGALCDDCLKRTETNPLRAIDCKNGACSEAVKDAPEIADFLSEENSRHFDEVQKGLSALSVPFVVNGKIVRGLDYYTRTVFEVKAGGGLGAQNAVAAGGRYDLLVEQTGGNPTPATGFAVGVERAVLLLESREKKRARSREGVFVIWIGDGCFNDAFVLCSEIRRRGIKTWIEHSGSSIKSQIKKADKLGALQIAVIGPDEAQRRAVKIRNMETGDETESLLPDAADGIAAAQKGKTEQ